MPINDLNAYRMLLADWVARLGIDAGFDFTQHGSATQYVSGTKTFNIGPPKGLHVKADYSDEPPFLKFTSSDPSKQANVDALVVAATERLRENDLGGYVWYSSALEEPEFKLAPTFTSTLMERLGGQTRVLGWRRLGRDVLLEFEEGATGPSAQLFAPRAKVSVHVAAPGPVAGHFSSHAAHAILETASAICTFALGRPLGLPPTILPTKSEDTPSLEEHHTDTTIGTLARKHISLDIFTQLSQPGGVELYGCERAALITCSAGMAQEHDLVACVLYVVAAECLTTPNTEWRNSKLTKRFIEFFDALMPASLDKIVQHRNYEEVFAVRRGARTPRVLRREFLDRLYDYRSGILHWGLAPSYRGLGNAFEGVSVARRALFAEFAESAILKYLSSPRSSLIGHPAFEQSPGPAA